MSRHSTKVPGYISRSGLFGALLAASLGVTLPVAPLAARPEVPLNLSNGLARLVENYNRGVALRSTNKIVPDNAERAVIDSQERILVDIYLNSQTNLATLKQALARLGRVQITAETDRFQAGVIEAYVPIGQIAAIARLPGVATVAQVLKPVTNVGAATSQGVVQHRVDQLPAGIDGSGITVGALSDSYDVAVNSVAGGPILTRAAQDIATGDLPGPANPNNTQPVVVIQEGTSANTDEGRGMLQIIHDLAPQSKLCFATANGGQVNFANNIRALVNPAGPCRANVVVDDIIYLNELMFQDDIVAQAVNEVAGQGISYFSSAGNRPSTNAYLSDLRLVPVSGATAGSNINLAGVPPALYAGGFHDFNPDPNQVDIAQTISVSNATAVFQWDDAVDNTFTVGEGFLNGSGSVTAATPVVSFPFSGTAGQGVQIVAVGVPTPDDLDIILTLKDPAGNVITSIDTGTSPETLRAILPSTGQYLVEVSGFQGDTGDFTISGNLITGFNPVTSDFNLLVFNANGNFLFAASDNNLASGQPVELLSISGVRNVQVVVSRANTPPAIPTPANRLRFIYFGGVVTEYFSYQFPATYGHNSAPGALGVAAYSPFAPYIPEDFTSPGFAPYPFDSSGNRLAEPVFRLKPDIAAMDGANNTFFGADTARDPDTLPNFFGTSAAAPHAAAIAALVLDAKGGPGSVTPAQMRTILQRSAFPHDLDPSLARGTARVGNSKISVTASGNLGDGGGIDYVSSTDPNFLRLNYTGDSAITSISFNARAGNVTQTPQGLVFDPRPFATGQQGGFPFTLGLLSGITSSDITATFSQPSIPPALAGQFDLLTLDFAAGTFTGGDIVSFGVDRDEAQSAFPANSARNGDSADQFGDGVLIPSGQILQSGVTFTGTLANGATFSGRFFNRIGPGYSRLDGFGFINAESAVNQPIPSAFENR